MSEQVLGGSVLIEIEGGGVVIRGGGGWGGAHGTGRMSAGRAGG